MARTKLPRTFSTVFTTSGVLLLVAGAVVGWGLPFMARIADLPSSLATRLATTHLDVGSYLGADITALAVMIAVVIGFNATALQIAAQTHTLAIVRGVLLSMMPFLACWGVTTGVALLYFPLPPVYVAQLWQVLLWFAAITLLMLAYLWNLPWRLSGGYVAQWSLRELRRSPIERWETLDGYSALLSAVSAACARGDVGTLRALTSALGVFLAGWQGNDIERDPPYRRGRYRAMKGLLSGCAQSIAQGSNAVAYHLGYVVGGVSLQSVAIGLDLDDPARELYSGLFRTLRGAPERIDPLWTGMRHALCRAHADAPPYLVRYWAAHAEWPLDDVRAVEQLARGLVHLYRECSIFLRQTPDSSDTSRGEALSLLTDLYRDCAESLAPAAVALRSTKQRSCALLRTAALVESVQRGALDHWPADEDPASRADLIAAFELRRAQIQELTALRRPHARDALC